MEKPTDSTLKELQVRGKGKGGSRRAVQEMIQKQLNFEKWKKISQALQKSAFFSIAMPRDWKIAYEQRTLAEEQQSDRADRRTAGRTVCPEAAEELRARASSLHCRRPLNSTGTKDDNGVWRILDVTALKYDGHWMPWNLNTVTTKYYKY